MYYIVFYIFTQFKLRCVYGRILYSLFLKLNPKFTKEDLIIVKEPDLCEGCGEIVNKTVLMIKESSLYKLRNTYTE